MLHSARSTPRTLRYVSETHGSAKRLANFAAILVLAFVSLTLPLEARAQVLYGSLSGNVTDPQGASVSGARVEVINVRTNESRVATTDERGRYEFVSLQVGVYNVTVSLASFKTLIKEAVAVEANTPRRLDAELEVGEVRETVVVNSTQDVALQTDRADVNITQTTRQVNDLPLTGSLGRNYQSLMTIVPGAVSAGEQNSVAGNPQRSISYNVNGVSRLQNNTRIDGAGVIYPWLPTNTVYVPPAESIQTVNIVTNSFDAEQGLAGGAAINLSIKSGSNEFHGAGWGYMTNSRFNSRSFFQPVNQPRVPKAILAQFGYAVGGPIIKDKLFFFTDLERTTSRTTARTTLFSVAPATLRPDASGNVSFAGTGTTIYDPLSNADPRLRTPFANNTIPANRIDIAARELISRLPLPNVCATCFSNNFAPSGVAQFNRTNFDVKINYTSSDKLTLFGRYSYSPTVVVEPSIFGEAGGDALNGGQQGTAPSRIQVAGIGGTYVFSPTVIFDANFGYTRQKLGAQNIDVGQNIGLELLKIPGTNGPDPLQGGVPSFQISNWANLGNANTGNPFLFRDNQYLLASNFTWLRGAHSLRFGLDYQNQQINHFQPQGGAFQTARGTFVINGNSTTLQSCNAVGTAGSVCGLAGTLASPPAADRFNSWAAFLLGLPTGGNSVGKVTQLRNPNSLYMQSYAIYARDHWQITRNITLTYGLRWERYPFPTKDNSGMNRFDPDTGNVFTGGLSGVPEDSGAESGPGQFLPRIGIAYRLNDKTVIRSGYGQSADPRPFIDFRNAYPIVNNLTMPVPTFGGVTNNFIPVTTFRNGIIDTNAIPDLTQGILRLPPNTSTSTYPRTPKRKEIHSWNLIVERELPWKFTGQVGYVGTRAVDQMGFININASAPGTGNNGRPLIGFGINADVNSIQPYGTATYDAMQTKLERRFTGSIFGAVYTWSKAINYADNDANPRIQYMPEKERNRGPAGYDRTHNFQAYTVWDLPFGKGQRWVNDSWLSKLVGGWQINGIMSAMSGTPFYVIQNTAANLNAGGSGQIPNQINPTVAILGNIGTTAQRGANGGRWFDTTAYAPENGARFGNVGRNNLRGPEFFNIDMGIFRTFTFWEDIKLQLRAEALNALNHPNFANPQSNISDAANFGFITSTVGQASRQWRFAARVSF